MQHYQVTLTTENTVYNLKTLVKAINTSFRDEAQQIIIQSDDGNTASIFLGGSSVTTANYGVKLPSANDSLQVTPRPVLAGINAICGSASQKLNISIFE